MSLSEICFDIQSALNKKNLYLDVVWFYHLYKTYIVQ